MALLLLNSRTPPTACPLDTHRRQLERLHAHLAFGPLLQRLGFCKGIMVCYLPSSDPSDVPCAISTTASPGPTQGCACRVYVLHTFKQGGLAAHFPKSILGGRGSGSSVSTSGNLFAKQRAKPRQDALQSACLLLVSASSKQLSLAAHIPGRRCLTLPNPALLWGSLAQPPHPHPHQGHHHLLLGNLIGWSSPTSSPVEQGEAR
jgi:hypothetical protein